MKNELKWMEIARNYIGLEEAPGAANNPEVVRLFKVAFEATGQEDKATQDIWRQDATPWCGIFVAAVLAEAGLAHRIPKSFPMARSWEKAGSRLARPAYGGIVVFTRQGGGHVGFVAGCDKQGNLMVLGGNQGDKVCIKPFSLGRVTAYRWVGVTDSPAPERFNLPVLTSDGKLSTNEA